MMWLYCNATVVRRQQHQRLLLARARRRLFLLLLAIRIYMIPYIELRESADHRELFPKIP